MASVSVLQIPQTTKTRRPATPRKAAPSTRRLDPRTIAISLGWIGVGVLALSVIHCCEAIHILTGSHWFLSMLLAVGIDAGMVASELAELVTDDRAAKGWAKAYVVSSILISMFLNAYAFSRHAPTGMGYAAIALGVAIPGLVFILGRVGGLLYR